MALDTTGFRAILPEFGDTTAYPDARVSFYLNEAAQRLLPSVWGELLDTGTAYFVAHRLALTSPGRKAAGSGNGSTVVSALAPAPGLVTSKSVGPVSKGLDVSIGSIDGAGEFNTTQYGRAYYGLVSSIAVGAMQF